MSTETLNFQIHGSVITDLAREHWQWSHNPKKAYQLLMEGLNEFPEELVLPLLLGEKKLEGVNDLLYVDDDNKTISVTALKRKLEKKMLDKQAYINSIQENFSKMKRDDKELYSDMIPRLLKESDEILEQLIFMKERGWIQSHKEYRTYKSAAKDIELKERKEERNNLIKKCLHFKPKKDVSDYWIDLKGRGWDCSGSKSGLPHASMLKDLAEFGYLSIKQDPNLDYNKYTSLESYVGEIGWIKITCGQAIYYPEKIYSLDDRSVKGYCSCMTDKQKQFLLDMMEINELPFIPMGGTAGKAIRPEYLLGIEGEEDNG